MKFDSCNFNKQDDGVLGLSKHGVQSGLKAETYSLISRAGNKYVQIPHANGSTANLIFTATQSHRFVAAEGGRIELENDGKGNVIVKVIALDGYVFDGWTTAKGALTQTGNVKITEETTFTANFKKK